VNSSHHQAVTEELLAPGLVPTVRIDGFVEALEDPAHRWVVAVQWHPERSAEVSAEATRIFRAFADAAARQPARAR
jgi:putative glutamine amidotransferase